MPEFTTDGSKPYGGFRPPTPAKWHSRIGYGLGVVTWLWVFYRARQDLPHMLVSLLPQTCWLL